MSRGRKDWCEHYRGTSNSDTCAAGVKYSDVTDKSTKPFSLPCIKEWNKSGVTCDKCEYPTPEQVAAHKKEMTERFERIGKEMTERFERIDKVRQAIVAHLGGPWKKGMSGSAGSIDCPACAKGCVNFSRSGYNGHIHARCTTPDCAAWME